MADAEVCRLTTEDQITAAQGEAMVKCTEELGAAVQALMKTLNYGFTAKSIGQQIEGGEYVEGKEYDNRLEIVHELGDVLACIDTLVTNDVIRLSELIPYKNHKFKRLAKYFRYALVPRCPRCLSAEHDVQDCEATEIRTTPI